MISVRECFGDRGFRTFVSAASYQILPSVSRSRRISDVLFILRSDLLSKILNNLQNPAFYDRFFALYPNAEVSQSVELRLRLLKFAVAFIGWAAALSSRSERDDDGVIHVEHADLLPEPRRVREWRKRHAEMYARHTGCTFPDGNHLLGTRPGMKATAEDGTEVSGLRI